MNKKYDNGYKNKKNIREEKQFDEMYETPKKNEYWGEHSSHHRSKHDWKNKYNPDRDDKWN